MGSSVATRFEVRKLGKTFAAEVTGLDLSSLRTGEEIQQVRDLLQQHYVVCFRNQRFEKEELIAFSERLGPLEVFVEEEKTKGVGTVYNVGNTAPDGTSLPADHPLVLAQATNAAWHTDSSFRSIPALASLLYAREVLPPGAQGGEDEYSDMFAAYDALSEEMKARLEPLHMVHGLINGRRLFNLPPLSQKQLDDVPPVSHPVVRVHRDRGGRRSLFITANVGREISGMPLPQGQALHDVLVEHVGQSAFTYRHRWEKGDLTMWDNRAVLHRAIPYDMSKHRRMLERTTLAGREPVIGPYSTQD